MANKYRGEIAAILDGAPHTLCLTLGALAELENAFGTDDMLGLANRFTNGRISANDCIRIIGAGLRGAGSTIADDAVSKMRGAEGAASFIDIVARLLAATFGGPVAGAVTNVAIDAIEAAATTMAKAEVPQPPQPAHFAATPQVFQPQSRPFTPAPFLGPR